MKIHRSTIHFALTSLSESQLPTPASSSGSPSTSPQPFVAVFAGGTSGIGTATLLALARHAPTWQELHIYVLGRNAAAAEAIITQCRALFAASFSFSSSKHRPTTPQGLSGPITSSIPQATPKSSSTITFIRCDLSLLANIPAACSAVLSVEKTVDILFLTQGYISLRNTPRLTAEGIDDLLSLRYYSRALLIMTLLPLLDASPCARVISVLAPGKAGEGPIDLSDLALQRTGGRAGGYSAMAAVHHTSLMTTLLFERLAERHPSVAFLHVYPGPVRTAYLRNGDFPPWFGLLVKYILGPMMGLLAIRPSEAGELMLFFALSERFPPLGLRKIDGGAKTKAWREFPEVNVSTPTTSFQHERLESLTKRLLTIPPSEGISIARGTTGEISSGAYCVEPSGDTSPNEVQLATLRKQNAVELIWEHTIDLLARVTSLQPTVTEAL